MVSTAYFILTKIVGVLFRLETVLVILTLLALIAVIRGRTRVASGCLLANLVLMIGISVWPAGNLVLAPLERAYPPGPELGTVEGIIVLGGGEYAGAKLSGGAPQVNAAGDRFIAAISTARAGRSCWVWGCRKTGSSSRAGRGTPLKTRSFHARSRPRNCPGNGCW